MCRTFDSGSYLQKPLLPSPAHLSPMDLLSCTKEMKTFIRKWVLLSHFWQLAGEHLRSPVTFSFCPSSLWLVAPRTCILLCNISYGWHSSKLLLNRDVCHWVILLVEWFPDFPGNSKNWATIAELTWMAQQTAWSSTKIYPFLQSDCRCFPHSAVFLRPRT